MAYILDPYKELAKQAVPAASIKGTRNEAQNRAFGLAYSLKGSLTGRFPCDQPNVSAMPVESPYNPPDNPIIVNSRE